MSGMLKLSASLLPRTLPGAATLVRAKITIFVTNGSLEP